MGKVYSKTLNKGDTFFDEAIDDESIIPIADTELNVYISSAAITLSPTEFAAYWIDTVNNIKYFITKEGETETFTPI